MVDYTFDYVIYVCSTFVTLRLPFDLQLFTYVVVTGSFTLRLRCCGCYLPVTLFTFVGYVPFTVIYVGWLRFGYFTFVTLLLRCWLLFAFRLFTFGCWLFCWFPILVYFGLRLYVYGLVCCVVTLRLHVLFVTFYCILVPVYVCVVATALMLFTRYTLVTFWLLRLFCVYVYGLVTARFAGWFDFTVTVDLWFHTRFVTHVTFYGYIYGSRWLRYVWFVGFPTCVAFATLFTFTILRLFSCSTFVPVGCYTVTLFIYILSTFYICVVVVVVGYIWLPVTFYIYTFVLHVVGLHFAFTIVVVFTTFPFTFVWLHDLLVYFTFTFTFVCYTFTLHLILLFVWLLLYVCC